MHIKKFTSTALALSCAVLMTACGSNSGGTIAGAVTPLVASQVKESSNTESIYKIENGKLREAFLTELKRENVNVQLDEYTVKIDDRIYPNGDGIDFQTFGKGSHTLAVEETASGSSDGEYGNVQRKSTAYLFKQDYSMIAAVVNNSLITTDASGAIVHQDDDLDDYSILVKGQPTQVLPTSGEFNYKGEGKFGSIESYDIVRGNVDYYVDFAKKEGYGEIELIGLEGQTDSIVLKKADINKLSDVNELDGSVITAYGIRGGAEYDSKKGSYSLGFFGPNAEEIVGDVEFENYGGGVFGATKQ